MNRLFGVVAGIVVGGAVMEVEPPAGVERTLLEQEFHLPEHPRPTARGVVVPQRMPSPAGPRSVVADVRGWLAWATAGQLGVCPLVKTEVW